MADMYITGLGYLFDEQASLKKTSKLIPFLTLRRAQFLQNTLAGRNLKRTVIAGLRRNSTAAESMTLELGSRFVRTSSRIGTREGCR